MNKLVNSDKYDLDFKLEKYANISNSEKDLKEVSTSKQFETDYH